MTTPCIVDPSIPLAPNGYPARKPASELMSKKRR